MPAPTNISGATAIEITLADLPYSNTQDVHDAGTTYTVWYKYVHPSSAVAKIIGLWAFGGTGTYEPITVLSLSITGAPVYLSIQSTNRPLQFPVAAGQTIYIQVVTNSGSVTPASMTIQAQLAPELGIPRGSIIINDDTENFPVAIVSQSSGSVISFKTPPIAAGESMAVLPTSGRIVMYDIADSTFKLYSPKLDFITSIPDTGFIGDPLTNTNGADAFWLGSRGSFATQPHFQKYSSSLVAQGTLYQLPVTGGGAVFNASAFCVNRAETILYWNELDTDTTIKRWDLSLNAAMADFLADTPGDRLVTPDMLYLGDNTIIIAYRNDAGTSYFIKRYSTAGATLNTYSFGTEVINHMAYAIDDPTTFWVWFISPPSDFSRIINIRCSDGVILTDIDVPIFEVGVWQGTESQSPMPRFGTSFSCNFVIARGVPGLFVIEPEKRTDSDGVQDVAIPAPTFRTALLP